MTCYQTNYLHWRSQCCYHCCLPQGYQRSQIWEWIIWQNIHLFTHLLFPIWQRLVGGAKSHTPIWSFTISQATASSVYVRQLIPILKGVMFGGLRKANFSSAILNHINRCLCQQSLGGWDKFMQWRVSTHKFLRDTQLEQQHLQRLKWLGFLNRHN